MAFQDRHYYRDQSGGTRSPLAWLINGSIPLFTVFGIRVRAHASLILTIVLVLLLGMGRNFTWADRVQSMTVLFVIVLLHEFGHCFAARWVGGEADDILMTPIGGLAYARPPRRWLPTFITVAAGPFVNVIICVIAAAVLLAFHGGLPWNPADFVPGDSYYLFNIRAYTLWVYQISWMLLLFNLLPIFPLDGGQMLQSLLWPKLGYRKSMNFACITGIIGAVVIFMIALATFSIFLGFIAYSGFATCMMMRRQLAEMGADEFDQTDYSAAYENPTTSRKVRNPRSLRRAAKRAQKLAEEERHEQIKIDAILAKVSAHGMNSLTWSEKRTLKKATEHQRQRDLELGRRRGY